MQNVEGGAEGGFKGGIPLRTHILNRKTTSIRMRFGIFASFPTWFSKSELDYLIVFTGEADIALFCESQIKLDSPPRLIPDEFSCTNPEVAQVGLTTRDLRSRLCAQLSVPDLA